MVSYTLILVLDNILQAMERDRETGQRCCSSCATGWKPSTLSGHFSGGEEIRKWSRVRRRATGWKDARSRYRNLRDVGYFACVHQGCLSNILHVHQGAFRGVSGIYEGCWTEGKRYGNTINASRNSSQSRSNTIAVNQEVKPQKNKTIFKFYTTTIKQNQ